MTKYCGIEDALEIVDIKQRYEYAYDTICNHLDQKFHENNSETALTVTIDRDLNIGVTVLKTYQLNIESNVNAQINGATSDEVVVDTTIILTFIPLNNYVFSHWVLNDNIIRTSILSFVVNNDVFVSIVMTPTFNVVVETNEHATIKGITSGRYVDNFTFTLSADVSEGFRFSHFLINGETNFLSEITLTVSQDLNISVIVVPNQGCAKINSSFNILFLIIPVIVASSFLMIHKERGTSC